MLALNNEGNRELLGGRRQVAGKPYKYSHIHLRYKPDETSNALDVLT